MGNGTKIGACNHSKRCSVVANRNCLEKITSADSTNSETSLNVNIPLSYVALTIDAYTQGVSSQIQSLSEDTYLLHLILTRIIIFPVLYVLLHTVRRLSLCVFDALDTTVVVQSKCCYLNLELARAFSENT